MPTIQIAPFFSTPLTPLALLPYLSCSTEQVPVTAVPRADMQNLTRDDSGSLEKLEQEHHDYVARADDPPVLSAAEEKRLIRKIDYKVRT